MVSLTQAYFKKRGTTEANISSVNLISQPFGGICIQIFALINGVETAVAEVTTMETEGLADIPALTRTLTDALVGSPVLSDPVEVMRRMAKTLPDATDAFHQAVAKLVIQAACFLLGDHTTAYVRARLVRQPELHVSWPYRVLVPLLKIKREGNPVDTIGIVTSPSTFGETCSTALASLRALAEQHDLPLTTPLELPDAALPEAETETELITAAVGLVGATCPVYITWQHGELGVADLKKKPARPASKKGDKKGKAAKAPPRSASSAGFFKDDITRLNKKAYGGLPCVELLQIYKDVVEACPRVTCLVDPVPADDLLTLTSLVSVLEAACPAATLLFTAPLAEEELVPDGKAEATFTPPAADRCSIHIRPPMKVGPTILDVLQLDLTAPAMVVMDTEEAALALTGDLDTAVLQGRAVDAAARMHGWLSGVGQLDLPVSVE